MSLFILNQLRCCRSSRSTLSNAYFLTKLRCHSRDNNGKGDDGGNYNDTALGQTVILVQQGNEIQELPVIMRKFGQDELVSLCSNIVQIDGVTTSSNVNLSTTHDLFSQATQSADGSDAPTISFNVNPVTDTDVTIERLSKCQTTTEMFQVIDEVPENELTQEIVVFGIEKIVRTGSLAELKNLEDSSASYEKLLVNLCRLADNKTLLDILSHFSMFLNMARTIDRMCAELLVRNSDGCLNIIEICESIEAFVKSQRFADSEKFWAGLSDQEKEINTTNIKFVYEILPKLKISRRMVLGVLERKIIDIYSQLTPEAVCKIMDALKECKNIHTYRTFQSITAWLNVNIHNVSETQLELIIHSFTALGYTDQHIEKALERYVKAKATKIKAQTLIVEILRHTARFRILNSFILNGCSEYLIMNSDVIEPGYIRDILCPYGTINYQPLNSTSFWKTVERYLHKNFHLITPRHIIDIMLSCVYLGVYPINFVDRIFNPYFLDLVHSRTPIEHLPAIRNDLKIFDTALTLECDGYAGPMLPRDTTVRNIWTENRIKRIVNDISDQITLIAGGEENFTKMTVPQQLPYSALYIIDVLFHPPGLGRFWNFNMFKDRNVYVATLIHLPEHYDNTGEYLTGPQAMRIRHLRSIGLKVVTLKYDTLAKLRVHRKELHEYLVERMREALPAKP